MILDPNGLPIYNETEAASHHPWCNYFMKERKGCRQCEGLYLRYPVIDNMTKTYFPNAEEIK